MKKTAARRTRPKRTFTPREANATLPLVRAITADLVNLGRDVIERRQRLLGLSRPANPEVRDPYREELAQIEGELEKDAERVHEYVEELRALGAEPKSVTEGLVDFPATFEGRRVFLCWRLGEPEVGFWHEADAGFRGRQPIANRWAEDRPPAGQPLRLIGRRTATSE
jgi:hypothetical protein